MDGPSDTSVIQVNCPFMAQFVSSDNFAGNMRVDGNVGGKPHYVSHFSCPRRCCD
jgi:hypothetical protein